MVGKEKEYNAIVMALAKRLGLASSTDIDSISTTIHSRADREGEREVDHSEEKIVVSMIDSGLLTDEQAELLQSLATELVNKHGTPKNSLAFLEAFPANTNSMSPSSVSDPDDTMLAPSNSTPDASHSDPARVLETTDLSDDSSTRRTDESTVDLDAAGLFSNSNQRYQIKKFLAQGGIGKVSVAIDREFDREVAFKEIRRDKQSSVDQVNRFWVEAQVTGNLEHPGIVPVYSLGKRDAEPFYAMRFIRGNSMSDAVNRFHAQKFSPDDSNQQIEFRKLLQSFVSVCNTIHFAHSRNVIHRDIKPDNVMLGSYGETLVVDWGLAKTLSSELQATDHQPELETAKQELTASHNDDSIDQLSDPENLDDQSLPELVNKATTLQGTVMGTLGYMSPEQLLGWQNKIDARSDVFSLGALLYAILTGENPNANETFAKITEHTLAGTTKPIRQINPSIPRPLAAIADRAMSPKPSDRYDTSAALAADVEAFLADEPVSAFPDPFFVRLRRWLRRHPALTSATLASILLTIVGLTIGLGIVGSLNTKLENANLDLTEAIEREITERQRAEENFRIAESAVETYLASIAADPNLGTPQFSSIRKDLLSSAIPFYQQFLAQRPEDLKFDFGQGKAHFRLGQIYLETGNYQTAAEQFKLGSKTFESLIVDEPANSDWALWQSRCQSELVTCFFRQDMHAEALLVAKSAIDTLTKIHEENPDDPVPLRDLASVTSNVGASEFALEKFTEAETTSKRHAELIEKLVALEDVVSPQNNFQLAVNLNNLGALKNQQQKWQAGYDLLLRAVNIGNQLVEKYPAVQRYRHNLAQAYHNIGRSLRGLKSYPAAVANFNIADQQDTWLARSFPTVAAYQLSMAMNYKSLGLTYSDWGRRKEALENFEKAESAFKKLVAAYPNVPEYRFRLAMTQNNFSLHASFPNDVDKRIKYGKLAVDGFKQLVKEKPDFADYRYHLATSQTNLALCFRDKGEIEEALKYYLASASNNERLEENSLRGRQSRFYTFWGLGECYVDLEQHEKAVQAWNSAAKYSDQPVSTHIFNVRSAKSSALAEDLDSAEQMVEVILEFPQRSAETYFRVAEILAICVANSPDESTKSRFLDLTLKHLENCKSRGGFLQPLLREKIENNEWFQDVLEPDAIQSFLK